MTGRVRVGEQGWEGGAPEGSSLSRLLFLVCCPQTQKRVFPTACSPEDPALHRGHRAPREKMAGPGKDWGHPSASHSQFQNILERKFHSPAKPSTPQRPSRWQARGCACHLRLVGPQDNPLPRAPLLGRQPTEAPGLCHAPGQGGDGGGGGAL